MPWAAHLLLLRGKKGHLKYIDKSHFEAGGNEMKKAIDYFEEFVKEEKRYPTLEEFKQWGYSKATYYRCKNDYKPTEPEEYGYATRVNTEQFDNGVTLIDLKF